MVSLLGGVSGVGMGLRQMALDATGHARSGAQLQVALRIGAAGKHEALRLLVGADVAAAHAFAARAARFDADLAHAAAAATAADRNALAAELFHAAEQRLVGPAGVALLRIADRDREVRRRHHRALKRGLRGAAEAASAAVK